MRKSITPARYIYTFRDIKMPDSHKYDLSGFSPEGCLYEFYKPDKDDQIKGDYIVVTTHNNSYYNVILAIRRYDLPDYPYVFNPLCNYQLVNIKKSLIL